MIQHLHAPDLARWLADANRPAPLLLDVREPWEGATCALPNATLIPMAQIPTRATELDRNRPIVCYCHHGMRSMQVLVFLQSRGFDQIWNLEGGIDAWSRLVDSACPLY
jgi:rhodanese-related sulfurtransferase